MKTFNAFQLTLLFVCWPFIITWLKTAEFYAAGSLFYVACAAFLFHFGMTVFVYADSFDK